MAFMNVDQLKTLLKRYGLHPNPTYGQNFLIDDVILQDMVDAAQITELTSVLEIGAGIGNLTRCLCERAGFVLSLEKDPKFLPILKSIKKDYPKNFRFEIADALTYDFQEIFRRGLTERVKGLKAAPSTLNPQPYNVVANIPYFITGKILKMLMTAKHKPSSVTMLVQKEVASSVTARAGDLSLLAISVQLFGEAKIIMKVPAKSFYPAPKVDSAVIQINLFNKPRYDIGEEKKFFALLRACFAGKRKQIHNTLVNNAGLSREKALGILSELNIDFKTRPQELEIAQWVGLNDKIDKND